MIKDYIAYLKHNPERYWFKRKLYGWGWIPVRWQGWTVLLGYIFLVVGSARIIDAAITNSKAMFIFGSVFLFLTAVLILICLYTGEKPKWQWGIPKDKE